MKKTHTRITIRQLQFAYSRQLFIGCYRRIGVACYIELEVFFRIECLLHTLLNEWTGLLLDWMDGYSSIAVSANRYLVEVFSGKSFIKVDKVTVSTS